MMYHIHHIHHIKINNNIKLKFQILIIR